MKARGSSGLNRPERSRLDEMTLVTSWPIWPSCGRSPKNGETAMGIGSTRPRVMSILSSARTGCGPRIAVTTRQKKTNLRISASHERRRLLAAYAKHVLGAENQNQIAVGHLIGFALGQRQRRALQRCPDCTFRERAIGRIVHPRLPFDLRILHGAVGENPHPQH